MIFQRAFMSVGALITQLFKSVKLMLHAGWKPYEFNAFNSRKLWNEWMSEQAGEGMSAAERASEVKSAEQANEWAGRAKERAEERTAQYFKRRHFTQLTLVMIFFGWYGLLNGQILLFWQWPNILETCSEIALCLCFIWYYCFFPWKPNWF